MDDRDVAGVWHLFPDDRETAFVIMQLGYHLQRVQRQAPGNTLMMARGLAR